MRRIFIEVRSPDSIFLAVHIDRRAGGLFCFDHRVFLSTKEKLSTGLG
jgi:hypothetical protein